ncbi:6119_t:CDS:2, partial [Cetraspora pellucida]
MAPKKINTKIYSITKAEFLSGQNIGNMTHLTSNTPEIYSTNDKVLNTNEIFKFPKQNEDFNWKQTFNNMPPVLTVFPESCSDNDDNNTTTTNSYPVTPTTLAASPVSFTLVQHYEDVNNFKHENTRPITPPLEKEATKSKKRSKRTREEYLAKYKLPINGIATRTRNRTQKNFRQQYTLGYFLERAAPIPELYSGFINDDLCRPIKRICIGSYGPSRANTEEADEHTTAVNSSTNKNPNYPIP